MTEPPKGTVALRDTLLRAKPADYGLAPTAEFPNVWAAIIEMRVGDATASVVTVVDGTTSLYLSTGGGVIGGGEHESVRAAGRKLLSAVEDFFKAKAFVPQKVALDVVKGAVTFNVLTYGGIVAARDSEDRLKTRKSPIWPLYWLGQDVITQVRLIGAKRPGG